MVDLIATLIYTNHHLISISSSAMAFCNNMFLYMTTKTIVLVLEDVSISIKNKDLHVDASASHIYQVTNIEMYTLIYYIG